MTNHQNITPPADVDKWPLVTTGLDLLMQTLTLRGNRLSGPHLVALLKMMELLAGFATGESVGRVAFPLPTGCGKTTGIVAFAIAAHQLGYRIPMTVAASQVQALIDLRKELLAGGIPEADIGLAHRDPDAAVPSTGCRAEDGRLIQLCTHARLRMGDEYLGLFAKYCGQPRPLVVYDESLLRADAFAFLAVTLESAVGAFLPCTRYKPELQPLARFLDESQRTITGALEAARTEHREVPVELAEVHSDVLELWKVAVSSAAASNPAVRSAVITLHQFLDVCQLPLRVLPLQGGGAVAVRQAVSEQLDRVVILDASTPIRELVLMDPSIKVCEDIPRDVKSFGEVEVLQVLAAGGREAIERSFAGQRKEAQAVSDEVVAILREELAADPGRCVLMFSFKQASSRAVHIEDEIRKAMRAAGMDPEELVEVDGQHRRRFPFLHWGLHTGLNGYEYCKTVVLAGILHRSHLDIAAHIKGQRADLEAATPHKEVERVIRSELGHAVYQAASRGSCRRVTLGKANPMRLWLVHRDRSLKDVLDPVMPAAKWTYREPVCLKKQTTGQKGSAMAGRIVVALQGLPEKVPEVSVKALKDAMGLPKDATTTRAFTRAVATMDLKALGWRRQERSLIREAAAYGFCPA